MNNVNSLVYVIFDLLRLSIALHSRRICILTWNMSIVGASIFESSDFFHIGLGPIKYRVNPDFFWKKTFRFRMNQKIFKSLNLNYSESLNQKCFKSLKRNYFKSLNPDFFKSLNQKYSKSR